MYVVEVEVAVMCLSFIHITAALTAMLHAYFNKTLCGSPLFCWGPEDWETNDDAEFTFHFCDINGVTIEYLVKSLRRESFQSLKVC